MGYNSLHRGCNEVLYESNCLSSYLLPSPQINEKVYKKHKPLYILQIATFKNSRIHSIYERSKEERSISMNQKSGEKKYGQALKNERRRKEKERE